VPAPESSRSGDAQVTTGFDTALGDAGLGGGELGQNALAVLEKRAAFVGQRDAPRGAQQQQLLWLVQSCHLSRNRILHLMFD